VDGVADLHAADHALRKGWVASVLPSGFAPNLITLWVVEAAFDS
jgi:hypothetical protein